MRRAGLLLTVGAMTTLLGCSPGKSTTATSTPPVSGITLPPTPVTTSLPATQDLPSGIYVDGRQGTPHYFITLTTKQDNTLTGTLSYLYQDGHNFQVFAFTATTQAGTATITVASQPALTATYGNRTLTLDACLSYLGLAQTATQCTFQFSPNGLQ